MTWSVKNEKELDGIAQELIQIIDERVVLFKGSMGAGKTTFIKSICRALKVQDSINSPTFSIVNEYRSGDGNPIYHFDFYRIESEEEAFDFGYEEYFYSGALCLVEWPEKIRNLLPQNFGLVQIDENEGMRKISYNPSVEKLP